MSFIKIILLISALVITAGLEAKAGASGGGHHGGGHHSGGHSWGRAHHYHHSWRPYYYDDGLWLTSGVIIGASVAAANYDRYSDAEIARELRYAREDIEEQRSDNAALRRKIQDLELELERRRK